MIEGFYFRNEALYHSAQGYESNFNKHKIVIYYIQSTPLSGRRVTEASVPTGSQGSPNPYT